MRTELRMPPEIKITSMVLNLAEERSIIYDEIESYTLYTFFSDCGGSIGLFLGLSDGIELRILTYCLEQNEISKYESSSLNSLLSIAESIFKFLKNVKNYCQTVVCPLAQRNTKYLKTDASTNTG